jgi:hypothetical protein
MGFSDRNNPPWHGVGISDWPELKHQRGVGFLDHRSHKSSTPKIIRNFNNLSRAAERVDRGIS